MQDAKKTPPQYGGKMMHGEMRPPDGVACNSEGGGKPDAYCVQRVAVGQYHRTGGIAAGGQRDEGKVGVLQGSIVNAGAVGKQRGALA